MRKTALTLIGLALVCAMLFTLVACGGGLGGTYTIEGGEETLKLSGDKWSISSGSDSLSGTYTVDGEKITFNVELFGETVPMFTGTVDGNSITIDGVGTYTK